MIERTHGSVDWRGLPIKRPYPWEQDVTICIAAECRTSNREPRIVLCSDSRSGSALGSAETAFKQQFVGHGWVCLTAGDEPDILAILSLYRMRFADPQALLASTIDESIRWPLVQRKKMLADDYTRRKFAISYDDFFKYGKDRLPEDMFREGLRNISNLDLKAEFVIAGFIDGYAEIYHFDSSGTVCAANNFAVVGSGEYVAQTALLRRQQGKHMTLDQTLYNVYEAKRLSESVGSVGKHTNLAILSPSGERELTSIALDRHLEKMYLEYGPKSVPSEIGFTGFYSYAEEKAARDVAKAAKTAEEIIAISNAGGAAAGETDSGATG